MDKQKMDKKVLAYVIGLAVLVVALLVFIAFADFEAEAEAVGLFDVAALGGVSPFFSVVDD